MKVKIGSYRSFLNPYPIAYKLRFIGVPKEACRKIGRFLDRHTWWGNLDDWLSNNKPKVKVKVQDWDLWSTDWTLAQVILPTLIAFRKDIGGTPYIHTADLPSEALFHSANMVEGDGWANEAGWEAIIDEMIWAFTQIANDLDFEGEYALDGKPTPEYQAWRDRKANGLRLFAKYFEALWN